MYAIIAASGRQYKVVEGQELHIDYRVDAKPGDSLSFDRVVAYSDGSSLKIGEPTLAGRQRDCQGGGGRCRPQAGHPEVPPPQNDAASHRPPADVDPREDRQDLSRLDTSSPIQGRFRPFFGSLPGLVGRFAPALLPSAVRRLAPSEPMHPSAARRDLPIGLAALGLTGPATA